MYFRFRVYTMFICTAISLGTVQAQKEIIISDSLAANAEKLPVKNRGAWFGKIQKFEFGEFEIVKSKAKGGSETEWGNFWGEMSRQSTQRFSFVLKNGASDTIFVDAANNINSSYVQSNELFGFRWGDEELVGTEKELIALMRTSDTGRIRWTLRMHHVGYALDSSNSRTMLTDGTRKIFLKQVSSNKKPKNVGPIPALGYEFFENDRSIAALQYYPGQLAGRDRKIVWLSNSLDKPAKLIIASAMVALLQVEHIAD